MTTTSTNCTDQTSYRSAVESDIPNDQIVDLSAFPPELLALFDEVAAEVLKKNALADASLQNAP